MGEYVPPPPRAEDMYSLGLTIKHHAVHHQSFKALWETKWKRPCSMGVYPFMFGSVKEFEPVAERLIAKGMGEPYDWDAYASEFFPDAEILVDAATRAEEAGEKEIAAEFFLRASALYRIARFPTPRSPNQHLAWSKGKQVFLRGQSLLPNPIRQFEIPHHHRLPNEGDIIPVFHLLPAGATAINPSPTVIIYTGLDGYRTELSVWAEGWRRKGVATVILEIPGTGDSPADPSDPTSPDRQMSSLLDWCDMQPGIDSRKICLWGFSTGGMYAIRAAHTHRERLKGVITLGGGCHHMFDREWLDEVDHLEYPFDLAGSLAYKFGYDSNVSKFKSEASKFSLLKDGTLEKPCTRLLLVNGTQDEIFPIEDMYLLLRTGPTPKEARFITGTKHMGEPASFSICLRWVYSLFDLEGDVIDQLKTIPFKAKFEVSDAPSHVIQEPGQMTGGVKGSNGVMVEAPAVEGKAAAFMEESNQGGKGKEVLQPDNKEEKANGTEDMQNMDADKAEESFATKDITSPEPIEKATTEPFPETTDSATDVKQSSSPTEYYTDNKNNPPQGEVVQDSAPTTTSHIESLAAEVGVGA